MLRTSSMSCGRWAVVLLFTAAILLAPQPGIAATEDTVTVTVTSQGGTVTSSPAGISCPPTCSASFPRGDVVDLTVEEVSTGLRFSHWLGCPDPDGTRCRLEVGESDTAVRAAFVALVFGPPPPPPPPPVDAPPPPPPPAEPPPPPPPPAAPPPPPAPPHPPSPPPTAGADDLANEIDAALDQLELGNASFNAPTELGLGETVVIQFLLSREKSIRELQEQLTEVGERKGAEVEISRLMKAGLTGAAFRIKRINEDNPQLVLPNRVTTWEWEVTPKEAGRHRLHLTLSAVLIVDGDKNPVTVETFRAAIDIRVSWVDEVEGFVRRNWQWLCTALVIPLVGVLWGVRSRRSST